VARIPVGSLISFTLTEMQKACGIGSNAHGVSSMYWRSARTQNQIGSVSIRTSPEGIELSYTWTRDGRTDSRTERLRWEWIHVGYGPRAYVLCPLCSKKISRIVFRWGRWTCKQCAGACSNGENLRPNDRTLNRSHKIRQERLKWKRGEQWGDRPKGMHWKTFYKLLETQERFEILAMAGFMARFKTS